jgi:hypothetical protein
MRTWTEGNQEIGVRGRADAQKAAKDTKTDQELGFCHDPALPKEWGPRNTRKDAKWDERCGPGGLCHVARPDIAESTPTLCFLCYLLFKLFSLLPSVKAVSGNLNHEFSRCFSPFQIAMRLGEFG